MKLNQSETAIVRQLAASQKDCLSFGASFGQQRRFNAIQSLVRKGVVVRTTMFLGFMVTKGDQFNAAAEQVGVTK